MAFGLWSIVKAFNEFCFQLIGHCGFLDFDFYSLGLDSRYEAMGFNKLNTPSFNHIGIESNVRKFLNVQ